MKKYRFKLKEKSGASPPSCLLWSRRCCCPPCWISPAPGYV